MSTGSPLVSVITPAYNAEAFVREAIESILAQTHKPVEIIVVDDGSTDGTAQVIARFCEEVKYLHQSNRGPAIARNRGIAAAQGAILAFLDADDLWTEGALESQISCLERNPSAGIVLGHTQLLRMEDSGGALRFESFGDPWHLFQLGAAAIRREAFEKVGLLDESMRSAEDVDWFLRARETGIPLTLNPRVVLHYRLHGANISRQKAWRDAHLAAAFKKSLDRRRQREEGLSPLPAWFAVGGREAKGS